MALPSLPPSIRRPLVGLVSSLLALPALLASSAEATGPTSGEVRGPRPIDLRPCHLEGYSEQILCGHLDVAENPDDPTGRQISLRLAVVPAKSPQPEPDPVFVLAGGPGQGATRMVSLVGGPLEEIHLDRDLVFVDQRGTGASHALDCDFGDGDGVDLFVEADMPLELLARCREELEERADLRFYTTFHAMPDLNRVREALGYGRINLLGVSYGTRAALVFQDLFPEHTRALVLDGSAPFEIKLPLYYARDAQRALDLLFDACAADPACHRAFPDPRGQLDAVLERLDQEPLQVRMPHPTDGRPLELTVTREAVVSTLRTALYQTSRASLLPRLVAEMAEGNPQPLVALGLASTRAAADTLSLGLTLSVLCSEDLGRIDPAEVDEAVADTFLGRSAIDSWSSACEGWPTAELPNGFHRLEPSSTPTLLLSGEADPATPPSWAETLAGTLGSSRHIVVPGTGHNTFHAGCLPRLMAEFLDRAGSADPFDGLDDSCAREASRPPFVIDSAGPMP